MKWTAECQQAFEQLKQLCSQTTILAHANYKKSFKLHTDASERGLGAVLYQQQITVGPEIGAVTEMVTGIPTDDITKGKTVVKGMVIETKIMADPGIEIGGIGVAPEKAPNPEAVPKTDMRAEGK